MHYQVIFLLKISIWTYLQKLKSHIRSSMYTKYGCHFLSSFSSREFKLLLNFEYFALLYLSNTTLRFKKQIQNTDPPAFKKMNYIISLQEVYLVYHSQGNLRIKVYGCMWIVTWVISEHKLSPSREFGHMIDSFANGCSELIMVAPFILVAPFLHPLFWCSKHFQLISILLETQKFQRKKWGVYNNVFLAYCNCI